MNAPTRADPRPQVPRGAAAPAAARRLLAGLALLLAGCMAAHPPAILVTFRHPGASTEEVEQSIAGSLARQLAALTGVEQVASICASGQGEIYLRCAVGVDPAEFASRVDAAVERAAAELPAGAEVEMATIVHARQFPPPVDIVQVPTYRLNVDRAKAAALGIPAKTLDDALANVELRGGQMPNVAIDLGDGRRAPLAELATVEVTYEPSHRVRFWSAEDFSEQRQGERLRRAENGGGAQDPAGGVE